MRKTTNFIKAVALGLGVMTASAAIAQDYPTRPIKMIVAYPAGQGTDINARYFADKLGQKLGQPVVVENRAGASGNVGTAAAARAEPDGYTLIMGASGTHAMNPALFSQPGFNALADFVPIAATIVIPMAISVHQSVPANNLQELISWAKGQGKEVDVAIPSVTAQLVLEQLKKQSNAPMRVIRYKGAGEAQAAVVGNQMPVLIDTLASSSRHFDKLKPIAITASKRANSRPNVKTVAEQGYPGFSVTAWNVLYAIKGTPKPIVEKLRAAMKEILARPETLVAINKFGFEMAEWMSADQLNAFTKAEFDMFGNAIRAANMQIN